MSTCFNYIPFYISANKSYLPPVAGFGAYGADGFGPADGAGAGTPCEGGGGGGGRPLGGGGGGGGGGAFPGGGGGGGTPYCCFGGGGAGTLGGGGGALGFY